MPGAVPHTSTAALNNATLPYTPTLADLGWRRACTEDPHLRNGINIHAGEVACEAVARALDFDLPPSLVPAHG
jgi:alanine dehydrogenase